MKILLCHNYYQQGGGEDQVFHDERRLLQSRGHEALTYVKHNDAIQGGRAALAAVSAVWSQASYRELRRILRRERPDVMHCTNTFPLISPAAHYAARAEGVPVVQSLHNFRLLCVNGFLLRDGRPCEDCLGKLMAWRGAMHRCYRGSRAASAAVAAMQGVHWLMGTWSGMVDLFVAVSDFARDKLTQGGLPPEKIVVKPNFVDPDYGMGEGDGGYAVFVGRLSPEKGIAVLLDAWRRLPGEMRLKIVGDGPLLPMVQEAARADPRIEPLGRLPLERTLEVVGRAAMLVMPSVWYETFGRTIVEAFSRGVPAVVSRMGAMRELVEDGRTGLHFQPGDAADLAEKLQRLWSDAPLREQMRHDARAEYERRYTPEANYQQLLSIYQRVTAGASAPCAAAVET